MIPNIARMLRIFSQTPFRPPFRFSQLASPPILDPSGHLLSVCTSRRRLLLLLLAVLSASRAAAIFTTVPTLLPALLLHAAPLFLLSRGPVHSAAAVRSVLLPHPPLRAHSPSFGGKYFSSPSRSTPWLAMAKEGRTTRSSKGKKEEELAADEAVANKKRGREPKEKPSEEKQLKQASSTPCLCARCAKPSAEVPYGATRGKQLLPRLLHPRRLCRRQQKR